MTIPSSARAPVRSFDTVVTDARRSPAERRVQALEAECERLRRDLENTGRDRDWWQTVATAREHEITILRGQLDAAAGASSPIPAEAGRRLLGRCAEDGCDAERELRKDGLMRIHNHGRQRCAGGRRPPEPGTVRPLPADPAAPIPAA